MWVLSKFGRHEYHFIAQVQSTEVIKKKLVCIKRRENSGADGNLASESHRPIEFNVFCLSIISCLSK